MKQTFLIFILTAILASCSSENDLTMMPIDPPGEYPSITIQRLQRLNDSISQNGTYTHMSRSWHRGLFVVGADILGAYNWGRKGAVVGSWTGAVHGAAIGAIIGGTLGAIKYSYQAYRMSGGSVAIEEDKSALLYLTNAYCSLNVINETDFDYCLAFPSDGQLLENVGEYHNRALTYLILNDGNGLSPMSDELDNPALDPVLPTLELSPIERNIIESEEFSLEFDADETILNMNCIEDFEFDESESGTILDLFIEAIDNYSGTTSIPDVISITNQYIEIVSNSLELSQTEKENLFIAFSVGAYSYKYWAEYYAE